MSYSFTQIFHKKIEFFRLKIKVLKVLFFGMHNDLGKKFSILKMLSLLELKA